MSPNINVIGGLAVLAAMAADPSARPSPHRKGRPAKKQTKRERAEKRRRKIARVSKQRNRR